jgi:hypothetical protein
MPLVRPADLTDDGRAGAQPHELHDRSDSIDISHALLADNAFRDRLDIDDLEYFAFESVQEQPDGRVGDHGRGHHVGRRIAAGRGLGGRWTGVDQSARPSSGKAKFGANGESFRWRARARELGDGGRDQPVGFATRAGMPPRPHRVAKIFRKVSRQRWLRRTSHSGARTAPVGTRNETGHSGAPPIGRGPLLRSTEPIPRSAWPRYAGPP